MKKLTEKKVIRDLFLLLLLLGAMLVTTYYLPFQNNKENFLNSWRIKNEMPAVVATVSSGSNTRTFSVGFSDIYQKIPITNSALFRIGSVTKTFISAEILLLESQGKLSINDTLKMWLPQYPEWQSITIKQLLNMTSGVYNYSENAVLEQENVLFPDKRWQTLELVNIAYQHPLYFSPGQDWHYSNTNYLIASMIIEKATNRPVNVAIERDLIRPLHLVNTYYIKSIIPIFFKNKLINGYHDDKEVTWQSQQGDTMISNTRDIATWIRALFTTLLPPKQRQELQDTFQYHNDFEPKGSAYGLGVFSLETKCFGKIFWYAGIEQGYSALFIWMPNEKKVVTVMVNRMFTNDETQLFPHRALFDYFLASNCKINNSGFEKNKVFDFSNTIISRIINYDVIYHPAFKR